MNLSQVGINLIKSFEGCRLVAYKAVPTEKYYTIGWGHYGNDVMEGEIITQATADEMFLEDIQKYVDGVNGCVRVSINQYQFDSLVSLCYNIGVGALQTSTLVKKLNKGDFMGASNEFDCWIHSGGKVLQGLVSRRLAEKTLFNREIENVSKPMQVVKVLNETDIRSNPDHSSGFIRNARVGEVFNVWDRKEDWHYIIVDANNGVTGWIDGNNGQNLYWVNNPNVGFEQTIQDYTIRTGENLSAIAKRMNTSVDELMNLNPQIANRNFVKSGQKIKVPK